MNSAPPPSPYLFPKFSATPPTRKFGFFPAVSKIHASIAVVVVFPCVPLTTIDCFPGRNTSSNISGNERYGIFLSSTSSSSGFPRAMMLPITAKSGAGCKCAASNELKNEIPRLSRSVEAGGYTPASEPVTRYPLSRNIPASGAIADPPIPITCTCLPSLKLPPPVPKIRAFLRLPRPASPRFPKEPSTWAAACAPLAHQRPAARQAAAECVHKRRAPLATPPQTAHFPEILPARFLSLPRVFQPASDASARDPPGRVSSRDLPERVSNPWCPTPTAFRWWPPTGSCSRPALFRWPYRPASALLAVAASSHPLSDARPAKKNSRRSPWVLLRRCSVPPRPSDRKNPPSDIAARDRSATK